MELVQWNLTVDRSRDDKQSDSQISQVIPGTPKDMGPPYGKRDPYYSHIFRDSYGDDEFPRTVEHMFFRTSNDRKMMSIVSEGRKMKQKEDQDEGYVYQGYEFPMSGYVVL